MQTTSVLRRSWWLALALGASMNSCAPENAVETPNDADDFITEEVTDVSHSIVKNQTIGNCWAYATAGWAEAMHKAWVSANASNTSLPANTYRDANINISESWITFWDWYAKISSGSGVTTTNGRAEISTGGWHDSAADILRRRGVVFEADFIPEEANAQSSARQRSALAAMNTALNAGGALATAADRSNKTKVLEALLTAWGLSDTVKSTILRVYGMDGARTLVSVSSSTDLAFIRRARDIRVRTPVFRSGRVVQQDTTLEQVAPGGTYQWRSASYPTFTSGQPAFHQRVMRALNDRAPVLISWLVDFNYRAGAVFQVPMTPPSPGRQGGHLTALEDYQVTIRQPGQQPRTLRAGEMASAADMALAVQYGTVDFYRIKNSWGTNVTPPDAPMDLSGYNDLHMSYLNGPIQWTTGSSTSPRTPFSSVTLPPGY